MVLISRLKPKPDNFMLPVTNMITVIMSQEAGPRLRTVKAFCNLIISTQGQAVGMEGPWPRHLST